MQAYWQFYLENNRNYTEKDLNLTDLYFKEISEIPLLSKEENELLFKKAKKGNKKAKERIIEWNLRLVISITKKFAWAKIDLIDLIQEWNLWLAKAIDMYDPDKWYAFSTYATYWIKYYIVKAIVEMSNIIDTPVYLITEINKYNNTMQELLQKWHEPTIKDLADTLQVSIKKIVNIKKASTEVYSLEKTLKNKKWEEWRTTMWEIIEDKNTLKPDEEIQKKYINEKVNEILNKLSDRQEKMIKLKFGLMSTQS